MSDSFVPAIAACFQYADGPTQDEIEELVQHIFDSSSEPTRPQLSELQQQIDALLPEGRDRLALVYGGATKIKGYVFEAPKLPEIRGASALLDWVNVVALPQLWNATPEDLAQHGIVYANGGHILGFTAAQQGDERATQIEQLYAEQTLSANSVAVAGEFSLLSLRYGRDPLAYWIEDLLADWRDPIKRKALALYYAPNESDPDALSEDDLRQRFFRRKTFGELVSLLRGKAARRRSERAESGVAFLPLLAWNARCDSSGMRPAVWQGTVGDEIAPRQLSEASARKRYAGQVAKGSQKTQWFTKDFSWPDRPEELESESWEEQWERYLLDNSGAPYAVARTKIAGRVVSAPDVHEIGAASGGYIGMIYADGNNVGRLMNAIPTPAGFAEQSNKLSQAAKNAVFSALGQHLTPYGNFHPFEILAIGGDDLLLIVPANRACDIALAIGQAFERELGEEKIRTLNDRYFAPEADNDSVFVRYQPRVGLSAGVIIAQETAPIFFLRRLVEELLDSAKSLAHDNLARGDLGGAIDFMVLKSITMVTNKIDVFRQEALQRGPRRLTARPYSWHEFAGLLATIRTLQAAHVPRSQLYRLREVLAEGEQSGIVASSLEYLYTRTRLGRAHSVALQEAVESKWRAAPWAGVGLGAGSPPWLRVSKEKWETIWPDLVEAYEMIELRETT